MDQRYPEHPYDPLPPTKNTNTSAILGFSFAILGMLLIGIPHLGLAPLMGVALEIAGIILSALALRQRELRALSIAGLCIAGVGLILTIVGMAAFIWSLLNYES